MDYKAAGVDVERGYESIRLIKAQVAKTFGKEVIGGIGGFGSLFSVACAKEMDEPVLVSGTDGVGTKLKLAFEFDTHDTIGVDCVAMCVNDIVCQGAKPLFFLDYIASGRTEPAKVDKIVQGIAFGCMQSGCALIGGETAEMPGFYADGEYDVAGFAVGIVDKKDIIDGTKTERGDVLIGIASSGFHSNGFSLIRKALGARKEFLTPTRIYVKAAAALIKRVRVKGISHITGGGFVENIPRTIPDGLKAVIHKGSWDIPDIFAELREKAGLTDEQMFNTVNMGVGMVFTVAKSDADEALNALTEAGETAFVVGEVAERAAMESGIEIC